MPETLKVLGQAAPAATTETDLYTVPAATTVVVSSLTVCNRSGTQSTFRVSVSVTGAATANADYLYYDVTIAGNDTFAATLGVTLGATDKVRVYGGANTLSFHCYGTEVTA